MTLARYNIRLPEKLKFGRFKQSIAFFWKLSNLIERCKYFPLFRKLRIKLKPKPYLRGIQTSIQLSCDSIKIDSRLFLICQRFYLQKKLKLNSKFSIFEETWNYPIGHKSLIWIKKRGPLKKKAHSPNRKLLASRSHLSTIQHWANDLKYIWAHRWVCYIGLNIKKTRDAILDLPSFQSGLWSRHYTEFS